MYDILNVTHMLTISSPFQFEERKKKYSLKNGNKYKQLIQKISDKLTFSYEIRISSRIVSFGFLLGI